MVKVKYLVVILILVAAGITAFFLVFDSREAQIKKRFRYVAEKMNKSAGESPILTGSKVKSLKNVITDSCLINIPAYSFSREIDPETLSTYLFTMRARYLTISLKFYDFFFDYIDEESARVTVTAGMRGALRSGEKIEDIHEVQCSLRRVDNKWQFNKIEAVEVLTK